MESEFSLGYDIRELTCAELDEVCGGVAFVSARLVGDADAVGSFSMVNIPGVFSSADITGTIIPFSGTPTLTLRATADTSA